MVLHKWIVKVWGGVWEWDSTAVRLCTGSVAAATQSNLMTLYTFDSGPLISIFILLPLLSLSLTLSDFVSNVST